MTFAAKLLLRTLLAASLVGVLAMARGQDLQAYLVRIQDLGIGELKFIVDGISRGRGAEIKTKAIKITADVPGRSGCISALSLASTEPETKVGPVITLCPYAIDFAASFATTVQLLGMAVAEKNPDGSPKGIPQLPDNLLEAAAAYYLEASDERHLAWLNREQFSFCSPEAVAFSLLNRVPLSRCTSISQAAVAKWLGTLGDVSGLYGFMFAAVTQGVIAHEVGHLMTPRRPAGVDLELQADRYAMDILRSGGDDTGKAMIALPLVYSYWAEAKKLSWKLDPHADDRASAGFKTLACDGDFKALSPEGQALAEEMRAFILKVAAQGGSKC